MGVCNTCRHDLFHSEELFDTYHSINFVIHQVRGGELFVRLHAARNRRGDGRAGVWMRGLRKLDVRVPSARAPAERHRIVGRRFHRLAEGHAEDDQVGSNRLLIEILRLG